MEVGIRKRTPMKKYLIIVLACITASCNGIAQSKTDNKADFYVSTEGSDNWSGTLEKPNAKGTDGPFATLEQARDAVRLLKKSKQIDIKVLIREGVYPLKETVVFGLEDSGEDESIITYAAYPGETPVFSSGQEINDWKKCNYKSSWFT
ncbi:hypothetical protein [Formosa algae]|uniref:hypothetical protein n=1 Tax=Formosa algae TaxID=225843 RepID=UPI001C0EBB59|nr:hypothetical protein [Formosa algae]